MRRRTVPRASRPCRLFMRLASLLLLLAPPSAPIEARRGPAKGSTSATQAGGRAAAGAVVGAVGSVVWVVVQAEDVAVVGGAGVWVGEDFVGFIEEGEGVRGVGVGAISVGVVSLGEGEVGSGMALLVFASHHDNPVPRNQILITTRSN